MGSRNITHAYQGIMSPRPRSPLPCIWMAVTSTTTIAAAAAEVKCVKNLGVFSKYWIPSFGRKWWPLVGYSREIFRGMLKLSPRVCRCSLCLLSNEGLGYMEWMVRNTIVHYY